MGHKVLVVDDASFMRMMIKNILLKNSFEVAGEAADGLQAVEMYKATQPDAVLLDVTMPQMDGLQALIEIKKFDPNAKVIMCSAMGQESMVIEAIKSGALDFIVKPFQPERIIKTLQKLLD